MQIDSPWTDLAGQIVLEFPEWTSWASRASRAEDICFFNRQKWTGIPLHQFDGRVEWEISSDGRKGTWSCEYEEGIMLRGRIDIGEDGQVDMAIGLDNHSRTKTLPVFCCICFMTKIESFDRHDNSKTWVYVAGKPVTLDQLSPRTQEAKPSDLLRFYFKDSVGYEAMGLMDRTDDPVGIAEVVDPVLIARKSNVDDRYIGVSWNQAGCGVANVGHPCIHIDPVLPGVASGERVEVTGWLIFHEGTLAGLKGKFDHLLAQGNDKINC